MKLDHPPKEKNINCSCPKCSPSPKPCCEKLKDILLELVSQIDLCGAGLPKNWRNDMEIEIHCLPTCHQAKPEEPEETLFVAKGDKLYKYSPEVSPEKEKECWHEIALAGNLIACRKCGKKYEEIAPKKEKCTCGEEKDEVGHFNNCPTLNEQKGEWEEEFEKQFGKKISVLGALPAEDIKYFIATKLAQKEQAVKAEIRERVEGMKKKEGLLVIGFDGKSGKTTITQEQHEKIAEHFITIGHNQALDDVSSLLSDKKPLS